MATVDFHFVPTSGPISGVDALGQTEKAINELGGLIDKSDGKADEAMAIAQNAQMTAHDALVTAQGAATDATNAVSAANNAQTISEAANATAQAAAATADSAYDTASIASSVAEIAQHTAEAAGSVVQTALDAASAASETAQNAQTAVNNLTEIVDANALFAATDEAEDANELISPEKIYFTEAFENVPLNPPAFLRVDVSDTGTAATQFCWDGAGRDFYFRTGTIADEATAWEEWRRVIFTDELAAYFPDAHEALDGQVLVAREVDGEMTARYENPPSPQIARQFETLAANLPAGTAYTVPAYIVGSNKLEIRYRGVPCEAGDDPAAHMYREQGMPGEISTTVIFHDDLPAGSNITAVSAA